MDEGDDVMVVADLCWLFIGSGYRSYSSFGNHFLRVHGGIMFGSIERSRSLLDTNSVKHAHGRSRFNEIQGQLFDVSLTTDKLPFPSPRYF